MKTITLCEGPPVTTGSKNNSVQSLQGHSTEDLMNDIMKQRGKSSLNLLLLGICPLHGAHGFS